MPRKLHYERADSIAIITMDDGKVNTIEAKWIEEWEEILNRIRSENVQGILIRGRPGVFSAGLDLKLLPTYSPDELRSFVAHYEEAMRSLFLLEIPVVAEVTGHALAGGAVLLLACDLRISDPTDKKIGLNETAIGITLPPFVIAMAQACLNPPYIPEALMAGKVYNPHDALASGYLTTLVETEERTQYALETTQRLAALPQEPYRQVKRYLRERALKDVPPGPMGGVPSLASLLTTTPPQPGSVR